jgi:hypothetical protein
MKFSTALSSLLVVLPLVFPITQVAAVPALVHPFGSQGGRVGNLPIPPQSNKQNGGNKNNNKNNNKGSNAASAAASASAQAAPPTAAAATAAVATAAAATAADVSAAATATSAADAAAIAAASSASALSASSASLASLSSEIAAQETAAANDKDAQTSLQLDPSQVQPNLASNGQAVQEAGQVPSLTSTNNFINFCLTRPQLPLTNGQQITTGSCNPTVMGDIIPKTSMPAAKFTSPLNLQVVPANQSLNFELAVINMQTGNFVNAQTNYFAAPQQLNNGVLIAHSHITVDQIQSFQDTTVNDPQVFAFFKGLNAPAVNGILTATAADGLAPGFYRACSINTAANHQPALVSVAQHASIDDCIYFETTSDPNAVTSSASTDSATAASDGSATAASDATATAASDATATANAAGSSADAESATADATSAASSASETGASLEQQGSEGGARRRPTFSPPNERFGGFGGGRGGRNRFQPNFGGNFGRGRFGNFGGNF